MARQTRAQQFRESATEEDWKIAVEDHNMLSSQEYKDKYGFTWSAIVYDAVEKGLYTKQRSGGQIIAENHMAKKPEMFVVKDMPVNVKKVNRSVQLERDIYDRLKKLEQEKGQ